MNESAWPVPELLAAGVPEWLTSVILLAGVIVVFGVAVFLVYCVWAATRSLPRHEEALEVMERLDPAILEAFGVRNAWDDPYIDVKRLAALKPLLDEETRVRDVDDRLENARRKVALARTPDPKGKTA